MIITTTYPISEYLGLVAGETIVGANVIKDFFANIRDVVGGRVKSYEKTLASARETAIQELMQRATEVSAEAVLGVQVTYASIGQMLMVNVVGTAVRFSK